MANKILIIGASGFIGNVLYKELLPYYDVYGTYCHNENRYINNKVFFHYNLESNHLDKILAKVAPDVIISSLRGDFEKQLKAHQLLVEYCIGTGSKLLFVSTVNVFDGKKNYPSYETDKPKAESPYGRFKITAENLVKELPINQYAIVRLPLVLGVNAPRVVQLKEAIKNNATFEVFPNLIISTTTADKIAQQVHYIINKNRHGIFHLASQDIIHHNDLFQEISEKISDKKPIFKNVYDSNEEQYLAILPKENTLPKTYRITTAEVINDSTLQEEINTLKKQL